MTLTDFLLDRIAEDEAALDCGVNAHDGATSVDSPTSATCPCDFRDKRECEAKRRIVQRCISSELRSRSGNMVLAADYLASFEDCRDLALTYADHPDYQQEWKP